MYGLSEDIDLSFLQDRDLNMSPSASTKSGLVLTKRS